MPDAPGQSGAARPAPPTSPAPAAKLPSTRIVSIDALRGLTMLAMVLVNNPGTWAAIYPPLRHADWHGCTPTDLIFPFFLFIVGAAMAQSMLGPRPAQPAPPSPWPRIWKRAALLVGLGVALNAAGPALELLLRGDGSGFASLRLPGVLQRIGLCYLLACAVVLWLPVAWQAVAAAVMLLASWAVMAWVPPPEVLPASAAHAAAGVLGEGTLSNVGSLGRWLDLRVFGAAHLYSGSPTDPEGLLGTVPATVTVLMGVWAGLWQRRARAVGGAAAGGLLLAGAPCVLVGLAWSLVLPVNKALWTPSYTLYAGGWALVALGVGAWLFDAGAGPASGKAAGARWPGAARPLEIAGVNAILLFVASGIVGRVLTALKWTQGGDGQPARTVTLKQWLFESVCMPPAGGDPPLASLLFALANVLAWWLVLWWLWRRRWVWRV